jgi:hypothetical protein
MSPSPSRILEIKRTGRLHWKDASQSGRKAFKKTRGKLEQRLNSLTDTSGMSVAFFSNITVRELHDEA